MVIKTLISRLEQSAAKTVYDTHLADHVKPEYPYLLVWEIAPTSAETRPALSGPAREHKTLIGVMAVGLSTESVRGLATQAKRLIIGWEPGASDGIFWEEPEHKPAYGRAITRDKDTPLLDGNPVLWGSDFYEFTGQNQGET